MTEKIGYPDYIVNTTELDKDYDGVSLIRREPKTKLTLH